MTRGTDWNDLHIAEGLDVVREQLQAANEEKPREFAEARSESLGDEPPIFEVWMNRLLVTASGAKQANIFNTLLVLQNDTRWQGVVRYCEFSYRIIKCKLPPFPGASMGEWEDADDSRLRIWLAEQYGFTPKNADAMDAVLVAAKADQYHPVREYLQGLVWDKKPRVRSWLQTYLGVKAETEDGTVAGRYERYVALVGTMWLVSAVARVMRPPVKADSVLILEGQQGLG